MPPKKEVNVKKYNRRTRHGLVPVKAHKRKATKKRKTKFKPAYEKEIMESMPAKINFPRSLIAERTGIHPMTVERYLDHLEEKGKVTKKKKDGKDYWRPR